RPGWTGNGVGGDEAIRGFHSASMRLRDGGAMGELLTFMGYDIAENDGNITRYAIANGNEASLIDVENVWAPFAAHWKSLLVPGLAFVGLTGALLPVLPFVFFGGFLPYMAYTLQVYVLGQSAAETS
ncbi:MAG: hypothetical protein AAGF10_04910, partial [Verrucomicrobiota bacterium]